LVIKEKVQKEEEKRRRRDILSFSTSPMKWSVSCTDKKVSESYSGNERFENIIVEEMTNLHQNLFC
jgi:hypothetical protein